MWSWIQRLFAPPVFSGDEDTTRIARILNAIILFNLVCWIITLGLLPLFPQSLLGFIVVVPLIIIGVIALIILRVGYVQFVGRAFLLFLWIAVSILIALYGDLNNP
jgi:hypothetical protein